MSFAAFMLAVPGIVRLLLCLLLAVGISVGCTWAFHSASVRIDAEAQGGARDLAKRVLILTVSSFVFILGFSLGNLWLGADDARTATLEESTALSTALTAARHLTESQSGPVVVGALDAYEAAVNDIEWPLMQEGNAAAAFATQGEIAEAVLASLDNARASGADTAPSWEALNSSVSTMLLNARQRISQVPAPFVPGILIVIGLMGLANVTIIAAFYPTRLATNLVLVGILAGITGLLMFLLVEISNPYLGSSAVSLQSFG